MNTQNNVIYATGNPGICCRKPYGFFHFLWDVTLVCLTSGLWLIWIFVREMRKN